MPELPEVETVKRGLAPAMEGATIVNVTLNRPNLRFPFPENFISRLENKTITSIGRRAKYLTVWLDSDELLIMHLGMSGSFYVEMQGDTQTEENRDRIIKHDHVVIHVSNQQQKYKIIYNDPRRFGFMDLVNTDEFTTNRHFHRLGIEPTGNELDGRLLSLLFENKKQPLKSALLDQSLIAGLGNIYVCEALWRAKLSPKRIAGTISRADGRASIRADALATAIRNIIREAIDAGGSTLSDHRQTDGTLGYFQHRFDAYDREGETCHHKDCNGKICRITQSGRSTYYCKSCQR